jgi:plastocyanin
MRFALSVGALVLLSLPAVLAQQHAPPSAFVDFGVLPTAPLGEAPCSQTAPGSPGDPCAYKIHFLNPAEVAVAKGGEVTFHIHGGGHGFAIYEVSTNTTREDIGQQICPGEDPQTLVGPIVRVCNGNSATNAAAAHVVSDAKGDVVLVTQTNPPDNRVFYEPGRLMSANNGTFLNGGTNPPGPAPNGEQLTYRFLKTGRYLVICMNRAHFLNDWMFGFVDVHE